MSRHGKTAAMQRAREMAEAIIEANASVACAWAFDFGMNHEAFMLVSLDYLLETRPLLEAVPISAMQREIRKRSGVRNDEIDKWRGLLLAAIDVRDEPQMKRCHWQLDRAIHHMHMALSEGYREDMVDAALYAQGIEYQSTAHFVRYKYQGWGINNVGGGWVVPFNTPPTPDEPSQTKRNKR